MRYLPRRGALVVLVAVTSLFTVGVGAGAAATPPSATVSSPTEGQSLPAGPITFAGHATDDVGVRTVVVGIQNRDTKLWWHSGNTWGEWRGHTATLGSPNATSTTWNHVWQPPPGPGSYGLAVIAHDVEGNEQPRPRPWVTFQITDQTPPPPPPGGDTTPPTATLTTPTDGQSVPAGPVTFAGQAFDNIGVQTVQVGIQNRATGLWWHRDGTWGGFQGQNATLASPGATSTSWSYLWHTPPGAATYGLTAFAFDTSGNLQPQPRPWIIFHVTTTTPPPPPGGRPNIVLVFTDDQRFDTLWAMPKVRQHLVNRGVEFNNGFVVNPLCCPSRASVLKGAHAHTTGVYQNFGADGPFGGKFDDRSTIATWLKSGGYRTSLMGKYFNGYGTSRASYIPPGWDHWVAFADDGVGGGDFYGYNLSVNGRLRFHGGTAADYSTDVLAREADQFIRQTNPNQPLFLSFHPYAPHQPSTPAPRHLNAFPNLEPHRPPNFNEADVSDKPAYIRNEPLFSGSAIATIDAQRLRMLRSLLAVDDAVETIVHALRDTGRLANTMIVFTSDHGFSWGEHRWGLAGAKSKQVPYEESIRVPYVVRYDPLTSTPRTDNRFVLNIDLAPTFAALAGVGAPGAEGRSFLPLLQSGPVNWRTDFLIEHGRTTVPAYCGVRNQRHVFVRYETGEEELYDLVVDPFQLVNRATSGAHAGIVNDLRNRTRQLCQPRPFGVTFPG